MSRGRERQRNDAPKKRSPERSPLKVEKPASNEEEHRQSRDTRSSTPLQDEGPVVVGGVDGSGNKQSNGQTNNWYEDVDSDPNEELTEAYQKVEQTLANQQFGITT